MIKDSPSAIIANLLSGVSFQYFVATVLLLINEYKQELYRLICYHFEKDIYYVYIIFILAVCALKKMGGNNNVLDCGLYVLMTVSLSWSIVYLCWFYQMEEVLNLAATLFGSCIGLRIYTSVAKADYTDRFDIIGGLFGSTTGIVLAINIMSYLYVPFMLISMVLILVLSVLLSLLLMKTTVTILQNYSKHELSSAFKLTGLFYWHLPCIIYQETKKICKKIIDYQYI